MASFLLQPPTNLSPGEALDLAQRAPSILRKNPKAISASPLSSLFTTPESPELWIIYENLLMSCLRVGDDQAAHQCLERLVVRFGNKNERVMGFKSLLAESEASNNNDLDKLLKEYGSLLEENGANVPVAKRRVALLRSMGRTNEAISALNSLLDFSPTDAEAWAELADLHFTQGLYSQSIFALEEVLTLQPNAWNMHARLGEVELMAASVTSDGNTQKYLAEAIKRFCRSIELCDNYLRGYYGLKLATDKALGETVKPRKDIDGFTIPDQKTLQTLNLAATTKLGEIVRRHEARESGWQGYDAGEVSAAKTLFSKSSSNIVR